MVSRVNLWGVICVVKYAGIAIINVGTNAQFADCIEKKQMKNVYAKKKNYKRKTCYSEKCYLTGLIAMTRQMHG